jgi:hypothetical protein
MLHRLLPQHLIICCLALALRLPEAFVKLNRQISINEKNVLPLFHLPALHSNGKNN